MPSCLSVNYNLWADFFSRVQQSVGFVSKVLSGFISSFPTTSHIYRYVEIDQEVIPCQSWSSSTSDIGGNSIASNMVSIYFYLFTLIYT